MATEIRFLDNALANLNSITYSVFKPGTPPKVLLEFDTILECNIGGSATATRYPTESGLTMTDYKYKNPDTVSMSGVIASGGLTGFGSVIARVGTWDRQTAIENIRKTCADLTAAMTLVSIQTRNSGLRQNMTMIGYNIDETLDNYGSLQITMDFQQVPLFTAAGTFVKDPSDSNTQDLGITQTELISQDLGI